MKQMPPCGRNCPKRCAVPNCHDPAICGDWAAYQEAMAKWSESRASARKEIMDYKAAKGKVSKIMRQREKDNR